MANLVKKKAKLEKRIKELEDNFFNVLHKKTNLTDEINISARMREILNLKMQLSQLK